MNLTPTEQKIFDALLDKPDGTSVVDLMTVFPPRIERSSYEDSNLVAVHITHMRKKLAGQYEIVPIRGFGYKMTRV